MVVEVSLQFHAAKNFLAEQVCTQIFHDWEGLQIERVLMCFVGMLDTGQSLTWQRQHQDETDPIALHMLSTKQPLIFLNSSHTNEQNDYMK